MLGLYGKADKQRRFPPASFTPGRRQVHPGVVLYAGRARRACERRAAAAGWQVPTVPS